MSQIISICIYSQYPFIAFTAMGTYWLILSSPFVLWKCDLPCKCVTKRCTWYTSSISWIWAHRTCKRKSCIIVYFVIHDSILELCRAKVEGSSPTEQNSASISVFTYWAFIFIFQRTMWTLKNRAHFVRHPTTDKMGTKWAARKGISTKTDYPISLLFLHCGGTRERARKSVLWSATEECKICFLLIFFEKKMLVARRILRMMS